MNYPEPEYAQNVIVGVMVYHSFAWYVTDRDYWYLDYGKYHRAWLAAGHESLALADYSKRFDIAILNQDTVKLFLSHIGDRRVPTSALREMMLVQRKMYEEYGSLASREYYNDILDFIPCFFVNFDQKQFASLYPEMISFEDYIPEDWIGAHRDFLFEIPEKERYWMVDGHDLFKRQEAGLF